MSGGHQFDPTILREYDIRGVVGETLSPAAAEALGEIGDPQAVTPLVVALEDEHWSVRCAAAAAVARLRSPKAVPALVLRLDDADATVRRAAISALGEIADPRSASHLLSALSDAALQATAAEALRRLGTSALPEMERTFEAQGTERDVKRLLIELAGRFEDAAARRLLLSALDDPDPAVRVEAAQALGDGTQQRQRSQQPGSTEHGVPDAAPPRLVAGFPNEDRPRVLHEPAERYR